MSANGNAPAIILSFEYAASQCYSCTLTNLGTKSNKLKAGTVEHGRKEKLDGNGIGFTCQREIDLH